MRAPGEIASSYCPDPVFGKDVPDWSKLCLDCLELAAKLETEGWDRLRAVRLMHLLAQCGRVAEAQGWRDLKGSLESVIAALESMFSDPRGPAQNRLQDLLAPLILLRMDRDQTVLAMDRPQLPSGWILALLDVSSFPGGLRSELEWAGLSVDHRFSSSNALTTWLLDSSSPCLVLVNLDGLLADAELDAFRRLRESVRARPDILFIAVTDGQGFTGQLAVLRAGIDVFLEKPVTHERLRDVLAGRLSNAGRPYRAMLVDDDQSALDYVSALLEDKGIQAVGVSDPLLVLDHIADFDPDVLLVDIEMPACKGTELVTLLRQKDRCAHIPVIYLTAWNDQDHQMAARMAGGEDFLIKPVDPALLISAVLSRARRHRRQHRLELLRIESLTRLERLRYSVDQHAIISVTDAQGRILFANQRFCDISGYGPEDLLGRNHRLVKSDEHPESFFREMWQIISSGRVWRGEIKNRRADGSHYWVQATIVPFLDVHGQPEQYFSIRTDITEQRYRRELMEARAAIASQAGDDLPALLDDIVRKAERLLPGSVCVIHLLDEKKESLCLSVAPNLPPELRKAMACLSMNGDNGCCVDAVSRGEVVVVPDARSHPCAKALDDAMLSSRMGACWSSPIRSIEGAMLGSFTVLYRDSRVPEKLERMAMAELAEVCGSLLERVRQRDELRRREETTSGILRTTQEGFLRIDTKGRIVEVNPAMARIAGRDASEILGHQPGEFVTVASLPTAERLLSEVLAGRSTLGDVELARPDGVQASCTVNAAALVDEEGQTVGGFALVSDISERKRLETTLRSQAQILGLVRQGMETYVGTHNLKATSTYLLEGLLALTGSEYGFIGEVLHDADGTPYIKSHALTDISWDEASRRLFESYSVGGMEFRRLDSLFGHVMTTGDMVVSDDPSRDPRSGGLPAGHPPLRRFLGVPVYYGDELVGLYGLANRPDAYDQEMLALLAPFNASYAAIITAHRTQMRQEAILDDLKVAKDRAEIASRAKSEFLASMSHELRTPLNAILGFSQLIDSDAGVPPGIKDLAREIERAGQHLLELINDILDLARIEAGKVEVELEAVSIHSLLVECGSLAGLLARDRKVALVVSEPGRRTLSIMADRVRLKQVLLNLISNGLKYNRPGGTVWVNVQEEQAAGRLRIIVRDDGIGIAPGDLDRLFSSFERLGAERGAIQGTGIGLVISQHLARMMGGDIHVVSEEGKGSTFWIELPLPESTVDIPAHSEKTYMDTHETDVDRDEREGTVLYVEDNPVNLKLMEMALSRRKGIRLVSAMSAEDGLVMAQRERPDIILLDINLPGMDGYEGLQAIKSSPELLGIPVVAVTANAMKGDREKGLAAGFVDYVTKPFKMDELFALLDRWLPPA